MAVGLKWLAFALLLPVALVVVGMQVAAAVGVWGVTHIGLAVVQRSSSQLEPAIAFCYFITE